MAVSIFFSIPSFPKVRHSHQQLLELSAFGQLLRFPSMPLGSGKDEMSKKRSALSKTLGHSVNSNTKSVGTRKKRTDNNDDTRNS